MKTKIVDETFDENSGLTTVTLQNKYGHFTGMAQCHPDDEYSMFQGERIAATRANIKFCKFRIKQEKIKIKAIEEIINDYTHSSKLIAEYSDLHYFQEKIIKCEKTIEDCQDSIDILKNSIKLMDEERQKVLLRSKKNK